jgi:hypothetical protein
MLPRYIRIPRGRIDHGREVPLTYSTVLELCGARCRIQAIRGQIPGTELKSTGCHASIIAVSTTGVAESTKAAAMVAHLLFEVHVAVTLGTGNNA